MRNVYQLSPEDRQFRDASAWLAKLDRGLTAEEERKLKEWLSEADENKALFLEVAQQWDAFNDLSRLADLFPDNSVQRSHLKQFRWYAVAASMVLMVGIVATYFYGQISGENNKKSDVYALKVYETAVGEQSTVVLEDGSDVILNSNTRLKVNYTAFHRVLTLEQGEIHIDVEPDATRPLTVFANDNIVQAVGTSFNVEIRNNRNVEVVVTEGKVRVATREKATSKAPVLPVSSLSVSEGEEVYLGLKDELEVRDISDEDIRARLAWRNGDLVFRGEPLGEVMAEVGRYTTIEFVFLSNQLKYEKVIARFKVGDIDGLLAVLNENLNVAYERSDDGKIFLSSF